jgi:signal transduction histidine kinase
MFSVADSGAGLTGEVTEKLFKPAFFAGDAKENLVLRWAAIYGIVKQHHGLVLVDSTPGGGTAVKVYLPAAQ